MKVTKEMLHEENQVLKAEADQAERALYIMSAQVRTLELTLQTLKSELDKILGDGK